jgi:DNA-binding transcriptional ArsR family regulator
MFLSIETTQLNVKARLFRGFSDPSRLKIIEALRESSQTVSAIAEQTDLSQSNVSNHLSCLSDCGLVLAEKRGKFVEYRLSDPRVEQLLSLAESLLADVARGVYECTRYNAEESAHA